jgi:hypothetical protein
VLGLRLDAECYGHNSLPEGLFLKDPAMGSPSSINNRR